MGGVFAAYMVTTGLIFYRWGSQAGQAPPPFALAGEAVIFGATALLAQRDARLGTATAWAFTFGALLAPGLTKTSGPGKAPSLSPPQAGGSTGAPKAKSGGSSSGMGPAAPRTFNY